MHHVGPLAGAAFLAGAGRRVLFAAFGFVAAVPFLLRLHRRFNNWRPFATPEGVSVGAADLCHGNNVHLIAATLSLKRERDFFQIESSKG